MNTTSNNFQSSSFTLAKGQENFIINLLRNSLYSNKILAVVREYCSNARDANIENQLGSTPIIVNLPSEEKLLFTVKDSGKGLNPDDIERIFTKYGKSTKRNDNQTTGTFGLGCKSAFAITDSFAISSIKNGVKYLYNCFINESNNNCFALLMDSYDTEEESGTEISIPVKQNDVCSFLKEFIFVTKRWSVQPINNKYNTESNDYLIDDKDFKLVNSYDKAKILKNEIEYEINIPYEKVISRDFFQLPLLIEADERINLTPSRESIQLTNEFYEFIYEKQELLLDKLKSIILSNLNKRTKLIDKLEYYLNIHRKILPIYSKHLEVDINKVFSQHNLSIDFSNTRYYGDKILNIKFDKNLTAEIEAEEIKVVRLSEGNKSKSVESISYYTESSKVLIAVKDFSHRISRQEIINQLKEYDDIYIIEVREKLTGSPEEEFQKLTDKYSSLKELQALPLSKLIKQPEGKKRLSNTSRTRVESLKFINFKKQTKNDNILSHLKKKPISSGNAKYYLEYHKSKQTYTYLHTKDIGISEVESNIEVASLIRLIKKFFSEDEIVWINESEKSKIAKYNLLPLGKELSKRYLNGIGQCINSQDSSEIADFLLSLYCFNDSHNSWRSNQEVINYLNPNEEIHHFNTRILCSKINFILRESISVKDGSNFKNLIDKSVNAAKITYANSLSSDIVDYSYLFIEKEDVKNNLFSELNNLLIKYPLIQYILELIDWRAYVRQSQVEDLENYMKLVDSNA